MFRTLRRWTPSVFLAAAIAYFAGHALTGESGLIAWMSAKHRLAALEAELAEVSAERGDLEDRAARLREETLDLDYLEERARALVGVARPDDIVVPASARAKAGQGRG